MDIVLGQEDGVAAVVGGADLFQHSRAGTAAEEALDKEAVLDQVADAVLDEDWKALFAVGTHESLEWGSKDSVSVVLLALGEGDRAFELEVVSRAE